MKLILQRVKKASVSVSGETVATIGSGLAVLAGVAAGDTEKDADTLVEKMVNLRIFEDENGKLNRSVLEEKGELLIVSQFTLLADTRKGRRPSFTEAAPPDLAKTLVNYLIEKVAGYGLSVKSGCFGGHMLVEILNDGPVTIMLDSRISQFPVPG